MNEDNFLDNDPIYQQNNRVANAKAKRFIETLRGKTRVYAEMVWAYYCDNGPLDSKIAETLDFNKRCMVQDVLGAFESEKWYFYKNDKDRQRQQREAAETAAA